MSLESPLRLLAEKLGRRTALEPGDVEAIMSLPCTTRTLPPLGYVIREGEKSRHAVKSLSTALPFARN